MSKLKEMKKTKNNKASPMNKRLIIAIIVIIAGIGTAGFFLSMPVTGQITLQDGFYTANVQPTSIQTFVETENEICTIDGKPVIRMFSTTVCPHCDWTKETFESVMVEYEGQIIAHHWELNLGDDTLTTEIEKEVPESEKNIYLKFNPNGTVPTFIFGCRYYRIGNGYEQQKTLQELSQEAGEFKAVINKLLENVA